MEELVFSITKRNGTYELMRRLREYERLEDCKRVWTNERGERWLSLFCSENRRALEDCIESYRVIEERLDAIGKVAAMG